MQIKFTQSMGRGFLKDYSKRIQPELRALTLRTAEYLAAYYERTAPRETGALAESFYVVGKEKNGYADALSNFHAKRPQGVPSPPLPSVNSDYHAKVGAVASYTPYVEFWTPFLGAGIVEAQNYYRSELSRIIREAGK